MFAAHRSIIITSPAYVARRVKVGADASMRSTLQLLHIWLLTSHMPKETATRRGKSDKVVKAKRGKKDPNAPKRGLSAYMFFANEQRENVRDENPGISFGQVGKILGERWKALNDKQRTPYEAKAAADKKRYEDEKAAYQAADSE
ncbi:hypothetical protein TruAng_001644 [Truncatella angustata]|nr:hypothetical protein TruAng_001644 [Truncatella angustata]